MPLSDIISGNLSPFISIKSPNTLVPPLLTFAPNDAIPGIPIDPVCATLSVKVCLSTAITLEPGTAAGIGLIVLSITVSFAVLTFVCPV